MQAKPAPLLLEQAVVSFTFDDVPRSALKEGATLLESYGIYGTFYVAGSLAGGTENEKPCHRTDDLSRACAAGHEIASHGYYHESCPEMSLEDVQASILQNDLYLSQVKNCARAEHFAYPYGECGWKDKHLVAQRFGTGRGVRRGLNNGMCDLSDLRANGTL